MNRNRKSAPKANAPAESPKSVEVPKPAVVEAPKIVVAPKPAPIAVEVPKATTQNVITESAPAVGSDNESSATKAVKAFDPSEFEEISRQLLSDHNSLFNLIKLQKARIDQLSKMHNRQVRDLQRKKRKRSSSAVEGGADAGARERRQGNSTFTSQRIPSAKLRGFLVAYEPATHNENSTISWSEVNKLINKYVTENKLKDEKKIINCDTRSRELFEREQFTHRDMQSLISKHLYKANGEQSSAMLAESALHA